MQSSLPIRTLLALALIGAGACGGPAPRSVPSSVPELDAQRAPAVPGRRNMALLSAAELRGTHHTSVYDLVAAQRPQWLRVRGQDLVRSGEDVVVYRDQFRLGNRAALRQINVREAQEIRYLDPVQARTRWGVDHSNGAIVVITRTGG
jgi:hypothetical protein